MKMSKLYFTFYKSFCFTTITISLLCAAVFLRNGISAFSPLFWFKMITVAIVYYYIKEYKSKEFYFYKNLGVSKKGLWIFAVSLDLIIYLILIIVSVHLHGKFT